MNILLHKFLDTNGLGSITRDNKKKTLNDIDALGTCMVLTHSGTEIIAAKNFRVIIIDKNVQLLNDRIC